MFSREKGLTPAASPASPANNMTVKMRHRLTRVRSVVEDQPKSIFLEPQLLGNLSRLDHQMSENLVVIRMRFGDARDRFLRNDQHMYRRLRFHVVESDYLVILVNELGRDFARDDFLE